MIRNLINNFPNVIIWTFFEGLRIIIYECKQTSTDNWKGWWYSMVCNLHIHKHEWRRISKRYNEWFFVYQGYSKARIKHKHTLNGQKMIIFCWMEWKNSISLKDLSKQEKISPIPKIDVQQQQFSNQKKKNKSNRY